jgi:Ni/Co efflux regulator RcnB
MNHHVITAVFLVAGLISTAPVSADPPAWAGGGKGKHHKPKEHHATPDDRHEERREHRRYFSDRDYVVVREYYHEEFRRGKCPPGLAKKNNGCMPPGQAKKWHVGQPIPKSVVYYEIPPAIIVQLPPPRSGHQYVRVASDILLIAVGSGMVIDAIQDLGRM